MKVKVNKVGRKYEVVITQGVQTFYLDLGYTRTASKETCEFMAKMFRKALKQKIKPSSNN